MNNAPLRVVKFGDYVRIPPQDRTVTDIDEVNADVSEVTSETIPQGVKAAKRRDLMKREDEGADKVMDNIRS